MDMDFLAQADRVTLNLELAKRAIETAKAEFENAKRAYDELFAQAESHGMPKAKLKKLTEERVQALLESGILQRERGATVDSSRREKTPRKKAKSETQRSEANPSTDEDGFTETDFLESSADDSAAEATP